MRVVLQRVSRAEVRVGGELTGAIGRGFLLLVAFSETDDESALSWMADKVTSLRLFGDPEGRMDVAFEEIAGEVLVVSQFTLYGDARKGRRPSFTASAPAPVAIPLYERFVALLEERAPGRVRTGEFGAAMEVELVNDGPVTLVLDR